MSGREKKISINKSVYYLYLSEELFKCSFFLLFIVFGAIYYINYILPPNFSALKLSGLYFIVYVVFSMFYILFPIRRMLFSNLQAYKISKNLYSIYEKQMEVIKKYFISRPEIFGLKCSESEIKCPPFILTYKTDYYIAFAPYFVSMAITLLMFVLVRLEYPAAESSPAFNFAAFALLAAGYLIIIIGFRHFINKSDSTHRGFLTLFLLSNIAFSFFACRSFFYIGVFKYFIHAADAVFIIYYLYLIFHENTITAFVRAADRNIYRLECGVKNLKIRKFSKVDFNYVCRFVQTPYSLGFVLYDKYNIYDYDAPYYCDTSKEAVEKTVEVFSERITRRGGINDIVFDRSAAQFFEPVGVEELSKKYGAGQLALLAVINCVFIYFYILLYGIN